MDLNILLRGQSNSIILGELTGASAVAARVQELLGFDGVNDKVTLLFKPFDGSDSYTAVAGTALIGDWLEPASAGGQEAWQPKAYEQGLLTYVSDLPATVRDDPTVVLWLHNEYDSGNASLTAETWESAVRYDAAQLRMALTGSATGNVPYIFIEPIPLDSASGSTADSGAQAIRAGMEALAADAAFGARLTASTDDLAMDGFFGPEMSPGHMSQADAALVAERAARSIAEAFASYAKPGSPLASGNIDDTGPIAVQAELTGPREVTVTLQFDGATSLQTLDADAATGIGWTAISGSTVLRATGVALGADNMLIVSFGADLPAGARIHYGYGDTKLASGNAIYDDQGLPMRTPVAGLVIDGAVVEPGATQTGTDGADGLTAGAGGDTLIGGKGDDFLTGGTGSDTFVFSLGDGTDWVEGFTPGVDRLKFGLGVTDADVQTFPMTLEGVEGLGIFYGSGTDGIFLAGVSALQAGDLLFTPPSAPPSSTRRGTDGDDTLEAGGNGDTLIGGQGNDFLIGNANADQFEFSLGDGTDWIEGFTAGVDRITFGTGITADDVRIQTLTIEGVSGLGIFYGAGSDGIFLAGVSALQEGDVVYGQSVPPPSGIQRGTAGDDTIAGRGGGDTLIGGKGNDYMVSATGADVFAFEVGDGPDWIDGFTPGTDKLLFASDLTAADVTVTPDSFLGVQGLFVRYGPDAEAIFLANVTALQEGDITFGPLPVDPTPVTPSFTVMRGGVTTQEAAAAYAGPISGLRYQYTGTNETESVIGTASADLIALGAGNDTADGGAGDDRLEGGAGRDVVAFSGTRAQTTLVRNADGSWTATGPDGTDTLLGFEVARFSDGERSLVTVPNDLMGTGTSSLLFQHTGGTVALWSVEAGQVTASVGMGMLDSGWQAVGVGDLTGDGTADALFQHSGGTLALWRVQDGVAVAGEGLGAPDAGWSVAGLGDVNGDGTQDILLRHTSGTIAAWQMQDGKVASATALGATSDDFSILGLADVNGDGTDDVLFSGPGGAIVAWTVTAGVATAGLELGAIADGWRFAGAGDVNGDAATDLLFQYTDGTIATWLTQGGQVVSSIGIGRSDPGWTLVGSGDYNADGTADLLFRHDPSGLFASWEMENGQVVASKALGAVAADWTLV